ncbi:magnesium transporter [Macrolepiota fuliginosa MF-IS2]|uniref:Magnesium transporter n=1 Tax=Macrolepiota fuliginosa MF-IS2 TaxID=1400762 RepID=A0A9P5X632_9AGAR|nr:magnesium transporter [Macrolepiota fuliginosa MF-IS2]
MPRENSFTDSEGRSLTPDLEDEEPAFEAQPRPSMTSQMAVSPTYSATSPVGHAVRDPSFPTSPISSGVQAVRSPGSRSHATQFSTLSPWTKPTPKDRFRSAVRKVISMHRGTRFMSVGGREARIGAEPGVDPRRASADMQYGHIHKECAIEITDYSSVRVNMQRMKNGEFIELMRDDEASRRPAWSRARWINIGGVSWDVIKALSLRYDLHPLALEDVFHGHSQNRSKADYYVRHLFLRILCHQLSETDIDDENMFIAHMPRSASPEPFEKSVLDEEKTLPGDSSPSPKPQVSRRKRKSVLPMHRHDIHSRPTQLSRLVEKEGQKRSAAYTRRDINQLTLDELKRGERVDVDVSPMFIFLFRDGTIISIHSKSTLDFTAPITHRLRQPDTVLRTTPDPSILVHALLDLIVDRALQVVDAYHDKINKFERDILLKPQVKTIRRLHILSGDLILHKRTLEPIKTLVYGLRRYDIDRCAALIDTSDPSNADVAVVGFMSHKSKIYLADVFDHMEYILTSLDMFASIAENLINYSFNSASYDMNVVMRRLTLVTIIGLPLTLLTGYFGMNFDPFWAVNNNSDLFFWKIAIPVFFVTFVSALWKDFVDLYHYMQKKIWAKKVAQVRFK